jgi:hypothetical protein
MSNEQQLRRAYTRLRSVIRMVFVFVVGIRTISAGGGPAAAGVLLGVLFVFAGAGRLYLQYRGR